MGVSNPSRCVLDAGVKIDKLLKPKHRSRNPLYNSTFWIQERGTTSTFRVSTPFLNRTSSDRKATPRNGTSTIGYIKPANTTKPPRKDEECSCEVDDRFEELNKHKHEKENY